MKIAFLRNQVKAVTVTPPVPIIELITFSQSEIAIRLVQATRVILPAQDGAV
jgi:hypothetical protein